MNQRPQATPAPAKAISTPAEARKLAEELMDVMSALLGIIERETELVRAGKVREAMRLEEQKSELSGRYMVAVENLKNAQKYLAQVSPELLTTLRRHHDTFRAMLQINLTVLATAHAVSEGIVRGVNTEMQRKQHPEYLYGLGPARDARTAQHHAARGQPLAVAIAASGWLQFSLNLRARVRARFSVFPNTALRGAGLYCC